MKLSIACTALASATLMAMTHVATAGSSSATCSSASSSCYGTLSFYSEATIEVNDIAKCVNGGYPYISSYDFVSNNDGFSYATTFRSSSGTVATAYDCTSSQNLVRAKQSPVQCGAGSTGGLQIKFTCNNAIDSCEISWAFGVVCPSPPTTAPPATNSANTGSGATSSAMSTVAITATGQAAAFVLPALGAAVAMQG